MRIEEIRKVQRTQPFRPFRLHLADGREFLVSHSEFIWTSHDNRTVIVDDVEGGIEILDCMLVTSVSIPPARSRPVEDS